MAALAALVGGACSIAQAGPPAIVPGPSEPGDATTTASNAVPVTPLDDPDRSPYVEIGSVTVNPARATLAPAGLRIVDLPPGAVAPVGMPELGTLDRVNPVPASPPPPHDRER